MGYFITIERGLFGYYLCLCDKNGPIGRIEDYNYSSWEEAVEFGRELARAERIPFH